MLQSTAAFFCSFSVCMLCSTPLPFPPNLSGTDFSNANMEDLNGYESQFDGEC